MNRIPAALASVVVVGALSLTRLVSAEVPPASGTTSPYVRWDSVNTILALGFSDNHIYELVDAPTPSQADLTTFIGAPVTCPGSSPRGYRRSEATSAIAYASPDGHFNELYLDAGGWHYADLTALTGAPFNSSGYSQPVVAYLRSDGVSSVIYRGSGSGGYHVYEIYRSAGNWHYGDLSAISGAAGAVGLSAFVRHDNINSVQFTGFDNHIYEISLNGSWHSADLTAITGAPINTSYEQVAYQRSDNVSSIVYLSDGIPPAPLGQIYEIFLANGAWHYGNLSAIAGATMGRYLGPQGAYVRADGVNAVVYLDTNQHVCEIALTNGNWHFTDLTTASGGPVANSGTAPAGYARGDGQSVVVFTDVDEHVWELSKPTNGSWSARILY